MSSDMDQLRALQGILFEHVQRLQIECTCKW